MNLEAGSPDLEVTRILPICSSVNQQLPVQLILYVVIHYLLTICRKKWPVWVWSIFLASGFSQWASTSKFSLTGFNWIAVSKWHPESHEVFCCGLLRLSGCWVTQRFVQGVFFSFLFKMMHPDTQQPLCYKDKTSRPLWQHVDNQLGDQSPNSSALTLLPPPLPHLFWDSLIKCERWHWFHLPVTVTSPTSIPTKHIL